MLWKGNVLIETNSMQVALHTIAAVEWITLPRCTQEWKGPVTWCHLWNKDKPAIKTIWWGEGGVRFQAGLRPLTSSS